MGYPIYYVEAGDTLPILFDSFDGGTGASITLTGLATSDIEIYKDGSATQRASDNGFTLLDTDGIDFDGITGIHGFSIDLSDNSDAGFYAVGSWYHVVVSSVTIDAQTVSFIAAAFRIVSATRGMAGTALPDAAADAAGGLPISDAGGLDLDTLLATLTNGTYGLAALETLVDELESRLTAARAGYLDNINNAALQTTVAQTGDSFARLGAPAGASISADIAAIEAQTDDIGAAGAGLTAIPWNAAWDAEVQSEATDALNAYDPPTHAELTSGLAGLNDPTAAAVADAVWDEAKAGHVGAGSFGEEVQAHSLSSEVSAVETDTQDIQNRLPAALVGGRMDASVGAMAAAVITAAAVATGAIDADALAADFTDEIWDEPVGDGAYTIREVLRIALAVLAGKSDGGGTVTHHYRDTGDTKNVVTATVGALTGDRSAVTLNP